MKKFIVLGVLFALPLVAYLFFASGVHNFSKLPILHNKIGSISNFKTVNGDNISLNDKITILNFLGKDIKSVEGNAFNLNQKIYKKNYGFKDFQIVTILPKGTEEQSKALLEELGVITDMSHWKFLFGTPEDIQSFYTTLNVPYQLNEKLATPYVYIIDKNLARRGRDDNPDKKEEAVHGYDASSVAELSNVMVDDVKVILAEYRLELKKYKEDQKNKK